jgi:hypothetical protein
MRTSFVRRLEKKVGQIFGLGLLGLCHSSIASKRFNKVWFVWFTCIIMLDIAWNINFIRQPLMCNCVYVNFGFISSSSYVGVGLDRCGDSSGFMFFKVEKLEMFVVANYIWSFGIPANMFVVSTCCKMLYETITNKSFYCEKRKRYKIERPKRWRQWKFSRLHKHGSRLIRLEAQYDKSAWGRSKLITRK